jgi:hypothetical protein
MDYFGAVYHSLEGEKKTIRIEVKLAHNVDEI